MDARAISSLPVPVSPLISTVASVGATRLTLSSTAIGAGARPTISSKLWTDLTLPGGRGSARWSRVLSASARTRSVISTQIEWTAWIRPSAPRSGLSQTLTQSGAAVPSAHLQLRPETSWPSNPHRSLPRPGAGRPASRRTASTGWPTSSAAERPAIAWRGD